MVECTCQFCGKTFHKHQYQINSKTAKYCSRDCAGLARRNRLPYICQNCGKSCEVTPGRLKQNPNQKFCDRACYLEAKGIGYNAETATIYKTARDTEEMYWYENGKLVRQMRHRWVWEKAHGSIPEGSIIAHLDGNKTNNELSNLECITRGELRVSKRTN